MKAKLKVERPDLVEEAPEVEKVENHEMLIGRIQASEEACNRFIDSAEQLLEFESLERGHQHSRKNFEYAAEHSELHPVQRR